MAAIFCAIGGDDTIRTLPYIDFAVMRDNPKIFMGYSDTTINHLMMQRAGLVSFLRALGDVRVRRICPHV